MRCKARVSNAIQPADRFSFLMTFAGLYKSRKKGVMMDAYVALSEVRGNALEEHDQKSVLTQNEMILWHDYRYDGGSSHIT